MAANARHSKGSKRWGTDPETVARGRLLIDGRPHDLDPCTEAVFEPVVGALHNYSLLDRGEDGLVLPWWGDVICNPPGGLVREFWRKALAEDVRSVFWIGFSVEQLCVLADEDVHPTDFSICYLRDRIDFKRHDGYQGSPSHGNYVVGMMISHAVFELVFSQVGKVQAGKYAIRP